VPISHRLNTILSLLSEHRNYWDLCCDHGQLAEAICFKFSNITVHAIDISPIVYKKLLKALESKYPLIDTDQVIFNVNQNKLLAHLGDASKYQFAKNGCIIIAGIGSHLMINILEHINTFDNQFELILLPHQDPFILREYLANQTNYSSLNELVVKDQGKYYQLFKLKRAPKSNAPKKVDLYGDHKFWTMGPDALEYLDFILKIESKVPEIKRNLARFHYLSQIKSCYNNYNES
jgi:tRNA (adenine22-N1)-methyltransferase